MRQSLLLKTQPRLQKEVALKNHSIHRGAPRWRTTSRTHQKTKRHDIKDEQMTPL